mmetsp:Transcript_11856/g.16260  ORF Transcript_11856/g.16260 Transcript_11856/m.16260 type:complete len:151 (-) Transcript_11856:989-1441(-)
MALYGLPLRGPIAQATDHQRRPCLQQEPPHAPQSENFSCAGSSAPWPLTALAAVHKGQGAGGSSPASLPCAAENILHNHTYYGVVGHSSAAHRFTTGFWAMICQLVVKSPSLSASTKDWPPSTRRSSSTLKWAGMMWNAVSVSTIDLKVV